MNSTVFEMIIRVFGAFLSIYSFAYLDISVENIRIEIVSFTDSNYMLI